MSTCQKTVSSAFPELLAPGGTNAATQTVFLINHATDGVPVQECDPPDLQLWDV